MQRSLTDLKLFQVINKSLADRHQSLLGPLVEPVNSGTVSYGRELTAPHTQSGAHGREAQHNLSAVKQKGDIISCTKQQSSNSPCQPIHMRCWMRYIIVSCKWWWWWWWWLIYTAPFPIGSMAPYLRKRLSQRWTLIQTLYCYILLTFKFRRTRSMKNIQQFSLVSWSPAPFTSFLTPEIIFSTSSSANRPGISPDASRSLISTRKLSSGTWASVSRNTVPIFFNPAFVHKFARSSLVKD